MKKVCVLGGGKQGRIVAEDLVGHAEVSVVDVREVNVPGTRTITADLSDARALRDLIGGHDLAVGALPSRLGFVAARAAVDAKRDYVDIAFYDEDVTILHADAEKAGVAICPDCGLAPGISNLIVGRELARGVPDEIHIKVGGMAVDPSRPYGYVISWSVDDLLEEYTRPARIVRNGQEVVVPALSGIEHVVVDGVGTLEAFFSDGLRTLLSLPVPEMTEMTLRWPGHADAVRPLLDAGTLVATLQSECADGDDLVVLLIDIKRAGVTERLQIVERRRGGISAMARTTALTCAAFARWVLGGGLKDAGVLPPERIGGDKEAFDYIVNALEHHGIELRRFRLDSG